MQILFKREYISKICDSKELFGYIATWKSFFSERQISIQFKIISHHITKFVEFFVRKGYLMNTITYTIVVLSRNYLKKSRKFYVTGHMISGNQILVKSASDIDSYIIFFQFINKKIILATCKSCFGCFCSNEQEIF